MTKVANRSDFSTDKDYENFLLGVELGTKINNYIDQGYIIMDEDNNIISDRRFKFDFFGPTIGLIDKSNKSCISYGNKSYDQNGKIGISKSALVNAFNKFRIIHPKDIKKLNFKK